MMARAAVGVHGLSPGEGMAGRMRRTQSAPQLRCFLSVPRAAAAPPSSLKSSRSVGALIPFGGIISNTIRSFMFEADEEEEAASAGDGDGEMRLVEEIEAEAGTEIRQRANWVSRILELRRRWKDRPKQQDAKQGTESEKEEEDEYCGVIYDDDQSSEASGTWGDWDRESFTRLLQPVTWSETKLFSQLAFLCNKAYKITDIKVKIPFQSPPFISIPTALVSHS